MTNQEIDKRLALSIGYTNINIMFINGDIHVWRFGDWQRFDHTDPAVIWPIAEQFDAFPICYGVGNWSVINGIDYFVNSPATASALAVINYCESKK